MIAQTMRVGLKTWNNNNRGRNYRLEDEHVEQDVNDEGNCVTSTVTTFTKDYHPNEIPLSSLAIQEVVHLLPVIQKSLVLYESHWIGGQAVFLDIAPALLHYNLVDIFTLKLNEKLNANLSSSLVSKEVKLSF